jgi:hypothetical protein
MRAHAFAGVLALALVACATTTIGPEEAFPATAGQAYVLVNMPFHEHETYTLTFQRVAEESSTFLPEAASVTIQPSASELWRRPRKAGDDGVEPVHFGGTKLAPGRYVLMSHSEYRYLGFMSTLNVNCHAKGAPVYRFRAGVIHILSMPRLSSFFLPDWTATTDSAGRRAQADAFLAGYPNMTAPRVFPEPIGYAKFETRAKTCVPEGGFTFSLVP